MIITYKGKLKAFRGSWGSGLGFLEFYDRAPVPCENAPTVRALDSCFGDFIAANHSIDNTAIAGREIAFSVDAIGVLFGFTPLEQWSGPEIPDDGLHDLEEEDTEEGENG